jgi:hypothetical protein
VNYMDNLSQYSFEIGAIRPPSEGGDYEGYKFPEEKGMVLELIEEGLRVSE